MSHASNCIICAQEFNSDELHSLALSKLNVTKFKVCQACLDKSDPAEDYSEARNIINSYLKFAEAKLIFAEIREMLKEKL